MKKNPHKPLKINLVSEWTLFPKKGGGMYTAFLNQVNLLRNKEQEIYINALKKSDITHIHSLGPFAIYKLLSGKHTVLSSHILPETIIGTFKGGKLFQGLIKKYLRFFYNNADLIFAMSEHAKQKLIELGISTRIELIPNPLNMEEFKSDLLFREKGRFEFNLKPDDFVVLGVGNIIPRKGLDDFILVARKYPNIIFIWAGSKIISILNAETNELQELLKTLPENIRLIGHVSYNKMPLLYNAADVLLFPSLQEIAPMVIIEAAACGLPLILRDLPEYRKFYKNNYLKGKNIDDFADNINKLQKDKKFYNICKYKSLELASGFNNDLIAEEMLKYYHSILQE